MGSQTNLMRHGVHLIIDEYDIILLRYYQGISGMILHPA
jgi:hypothetical protein